MNDPHEIIGWLKKRKAEYLGYGSSRQVFRISPRRVIKVEYARFGGVSQNKNDVKKSDMFGDTGLVAKCFWYHPKYVWIVSEYAEKIGRQRRAFREWRSQYYQKEICENLRISDIDMRNCGMINNRIVIVDCGLEWDWSDNQNQT
jgi:hypothetical protein